MVLISCWSDMCERTEKSCCWSAANVALYWLIKGQATRIWPIHVTRGKLLSSLCCIISGSLIPTFRQEQNQKMSTKKWFCRVWCHFIKMGSFLFSFLNFFKGHVQNSIMKRTRLQCVSYCCEPMKAFCTVDFYAEFTEHIRASNWFPSALSEMGL